MYSVMKAPAQAQLDLSLKLQDHDQGYALMAVNLTPADLLLVITDSAERIQEYVLPPHDTTLVRILPGEDRELVRTWFNDQHQVSYYFGDPDKAKPEKEYLYRLPFATGKSYRVNQGFNGKFSHSSTISRYALDFDLDIGEAVHAARGGLVVKVEEHFTESGDRTYLYKANRIIILHRDGTTASYVHLKPHGSLVEIGMRVAKGQLIGYSGNTGFTRGPHLHFVVRKERDVAIPIYFEGYPHKYLKQGKKYRIKK